MRSSRIALTLISAALIAAASMSPASATPPTPSSAAPSSKTVTVGQWQVTALDLGTLGGPTITPTDVNSWGAIVGTSEAADGKTYPFVGHPLVGVAKLPGAPQYFSPARVTDGGLVTGNEAVYSTTTPNNAEVWAQGAYSKPLGSTWSDAGPAAETGTVLVNHIERIKFGSNFIVNSPIDCLTYAATTAGATPQPVPPPAGGPAPVRCVGITRDGRTTYSALNYTPSTDVYRTTGGVTTRIPIRAYADYSSELGGVTRFGDVLGYVTEQVPDPDQADTLRYADQPLRVVGDTWQLLPRPASLTDDTVGLVPAFGPYAGNIKHDLIGSAVHRGAGDPGYVGVLWKNGTTPEVLRAPDRDVVLAAINGRRDIAGRTQPTEADVEAGHALPEHAALWREGEYVDLGAAIGTDQRSEARWVTESGVVVGTHTVTVDGADLTRLVAWVVTRAS